jgi:hypothetical protein
MPDGLVAATARAGHTARGRASYANLRLVMHATSDGVTRICPQRRSQQVPGATCGAGGVDAGDPAEADEVGPLAGPAGDGRGQARAVLVAGADRRMAGLTSADGSRPGQ